MGTPSRRSEPEQECQRCFWYSASHPSIPAFPQIIWYSKKTLSFWWSWGKKNGFNNHNRNPFSCKKNSGDVMWVCGHRLPESSSLGHERWRILTHVIICYNFKVKRIFPFLFKNFDGKWGIWKSNQNKQHQTHTAEDTDILNCKSNGFFGIREFYCSDPDTHTQYTFWTMPYIQQRPSYQLTYQEAQFYGWHQMDSAQLRTKMPASPPCWKKSLFCLCHRGSEWYLRGCAGIFLQDWAWTLEWKW